MSAAACAEVDPERWDETLSAAGVTDVYYARGYVAASAALVDAEPVLLRLAGDGGEVLFACLLRRDPTDVVTPYGYGGPVGAGESPPLAAFPAAYESWCERRGAVSSFAVFHPLLGNAASPASEGFRRVELAGTVAWPLGREDLLAPMHKHHRRVVRRAQARGLRGRRRAGAGGSRGVRRRVRADDAQGRGGAVLLLPAELLGRAARRG